MDNAESYGDKTSQTQSVMAATAKLASESSYPSIVEPPSPSILIVGAGVFGISTAFELLNSSRYDNTTITIVDAFAPHSEGNAAAAQSNGSTDNKHTGLNALADSAASYDGPRETTASLDTSRIVRPDYMNPLYAKLAHEATDLFRHGWADGDDSAAEKTYTQPGLLIISTGPEDGRGRKYVKHAYENTLEIYEANGDDAGSAPLKMGTSADVESKFNFAPASLPPTTTGYFNPQAGWANASAAVSAIKRRVLSAGQARSSEGKAPFRYIGGTKVTELLFSDDKTRVEGVRLDSLETVFADLVILATGAWTSALLPSLLSPRLRASGQVLTYISLQSEEEVARYAGRPTVIDMESGMFAIYPPQHYISEKRNKAHVKYARHGWGYSQSWAKQDPLTNEPVECLLPTEKEAQFFTVPREGKEVCRAFARVVTPELASRDFSLERVCWYCDTPTSDFLIDFVPDLQGVLVATGGSGHGFKFLPVLGREIVARMEGRLDPALSELWKWKSDAECKELWLGEGDSSRGGPRGMTWEAEIAK